MHMNIRGVLQLCSGPRKASSQSTEQKALSAGLIATASKRLYIIVEIRVEEASPEALDDFRRPFREHRNERRRDLRQRQREMLRQLEEERRRSKEKQRHYRNVMTLPPIPHDPVDVIVFNASTTGLCSEINEILQISIIDGNGNVLLNSLV